MAFCRDCSDYLCVACEEAHGRVRLTRRHHLDRIEVSVPSVPSRKSSLVDPPPFANLSYFCRAHAEECHFWCHTCARPCCDSCLREVGHHADHDTQRRVNCDDMGDHNRLGEKRVELQTRRDEVERDRSQLARLIDETREKIGERYGTLLDKLNAERDRLYAELEIIRQRALEQYEMDELKLDAYEGHLDKNQLADDHKLPPSHMPEINLNLTEPINTLVGRITTSLVTAHTTAVGTGLEFVNVPAHGDDWAEFVIYPRGWFYEPIIDYAPGDLVVVINPEPACVVYEKGHAFYAVKYMIKARIDHEIRITYKDEAIGTWRVKHRDKRDYKHDLKRVSFGRTGGGISGEFRRPWGVCALPNGGIAVTDRANNRIQLLNGEMKVVLIHPEQDDATFNRPAGIAFALKPEPTLIIADKDNHQIQVCHY